MYFFIILQKNLLKILNNQRKWQADLDLPRSAPKTKQNKLKWSLFGFFLRSCYQIINFCLYAFTLYRDWATLFQYYQTVKYFIFL